MQRTSVSPTDLAYAAGVVDSDGTIGVRKTKPGHGWQSTYQPRVTVKQVTPQAVEFLHDLLGGYRYVTKPAAETRRPMLGWDVHSASAVAVCELLLPYLRIKREQAENALRVGALNASAGRRGWDLPEVDPDEPLLPLLEAARRAGRSDTVAYQCAHLGNIPVVRKGRRVYMPESYVETWRTRGSTAPRRSALSDELEEYYVRARELNRVGA